MMSKEKSTVSIEKSGPIITGSVYPLVQRIKKLITGKKKLTIFIIAIFALFAILNIKIPNKLEEPAKSINVTVDKSYDMAALNNLGKVLSSKIRFKIAAAEKTNKVLVKDQIFTAKNNKLFLIINVELKNDATNPVNLMPGDLVRLTIEGDEDNKYAPDLHNNLVLISAISTKNDRIGFVIPDTARKFKLYVGELEGKKETVALNFPT